MRKSWLSRALLSLKKEWGHELRNAGSLYKLEKSKEIDFHIGLQKERPASDF